MVLMALDHARDFVYRDVHLDPVDLHVASPGLFLTRWISHFCAPTFLLLAGVGAALAEQRGRSRRDLAWFLLTRGLWLIFLELVVVRTTGWFWNLDFTFLPGWVLWALGWAMITMAGLVFMPRAVVGLLAMALIAGHHLFDGVGWGDHPSLGWLWVLLHESKSLTLGPVTWNLGYPLVPWVAVLWAGWVLGGIMQWEPARRRRLLVGLGLGSVVVFLAVRGLTSYGEPRPWETFPSGWLTALDFANCTKQPPSLCFLLMTLGPMLLFWAWLEGRAMPGWCGPLATVGRVPLFFYLVHLPLIHALAAGWSWWQFGAVQPWLFANPEGFWDRGDLGLPLAGVYAVWLVVLLLLYPACVWFGEVKRRHPGGWLSYL